ncbi:MAG: hypothetical protein ABSC45_06260 [Desulfobaccales bacterium]|jgi:hypothetical protein
MSWTCGISGLPNGGKATIFNAKAGDRGAVADLSVLFQVEKGLNRGKWARDLGQGPGKLDYLQAVPLLTLKPCLFVANLSEGELSGGTHYSALRELAAARNLSLVTILGDLAEPMAGGRCFLGSIVIKEYWERRWLGCSK